MLLVTLARARDDHELPTVKKHLAMCGCECWITPSVVATQLAMDVATTCVEHAEESERQLLARMPRGHQDGEYPCYPREHLEVAVGKEMAERLIALAKRRMQEGMPI